MADYENMVDMVSNITGAPHHIARHCLTQTRGSLDAAVNMILDHHGDWPADLEYQNPHAAAAMPPVQQPAMRPMAPAPAAPAQQQQNLGPQPQAPRKGLFSFKRTSPPMNNQVPAPAPAPAFNNYSNNNYNNYSAPAPAAPAAAPAPAFPAYNNHSAPAPAAPAATARRPAMGRVSHANEDEGDRDSLHYTGSGYVRSASKPAPAPAPAQEEEEEGAEGENIEIITIASYKNGFMCSSENSEPVWIAGDAPEADTLREILSGGSTDLPKFLTHLVSKEAARKGSIRVRTEDHQSEDYVAPRKFFEGAAHKLTSEHTAPAAPRREAPPFDIPLRPGRRGALLVMMPNAERLKVEVSENNTVDELRRHVAGQPKSGLSASDLAFRVRNSTEVLRMPNVPLGPYIGKVLLIDA